MPVLPAKPRKRAGRTKVIQIAVVPSAKGMPDMSSLLKKPGSVPKKS